MKKHYVTINGNEYVITYTIRALFIFEQITGKTFELKSTIDNYVFFYSMILANNDTFPTWDEFLDCLDANPNIIKSLLDVVTEYNQHSNIFDSDETDENGEKKN